MNASGAGGSGSAASPEWADPGTKRVELDVVFPLPLLKAAPGLQGKRGAAGRYPRRYLAHVNAALKSLNWYAGYREPADARSLGSTPSATQAEVTARVAGLVSDLFSVNVAIPTPQSAFLELTRGRSIYDEKAAGANIARFSSAAGVSLPDSVQGAPYLDEVISPWMQMFSRILWSGC